jgi:hypothetical protein
MALVAAMSSLRYDVGMSRVIYGRSDMNWFAHDGHEHDLSKKRFPYPGYGQERRTLAVLDCERCRPFALKHLGFSPEPAKVELTADEVEYADRMQNESALNAQEFAKAAAEFFRSGRAQK